MLFSLASCDAKPTNTITLDTPPTDSKEEDNMKSLELKIDDTIVTVAWEDNSSVNALKELAKDGLTINMHEYGGFEQTGMLGSTITSNDS